MNQQQRHQSVLDPISKEAEQLSVCCFICLSRFMFLIKHVTQRRVFSCVSDCVSVVSALCPPTG